MRDENGSNLLVSSKLPVYAAKPAVVSASTGGSRYPFNNSDGHSRNPFSDTSGLTRATLLAVIYSSAIVGSHWVAYLIRFEFHPPIEEQTLFWKTLQWSLPVEMLALVSFGQFRSLLSYFSLPDARRIVLACATAGLFSLTVWYFTKGQHAPPRSIILLSFLLDSASLGCIRLAFRMFRERQKLNENDDRPLHRIIIIGAGDVGANLAKEMKLRRDLRMYPIAFFDDDPAKWNTRIHGVAVVGRPELIASGKIEPIGRLLRCRAPLEGGYAKLCDYLMRRASDSKLCLRWSKW